MRVTTVPRPPHLTDLWQRTADRTSCDHSGTCSAMYSNGGHPERRSLHTGANLNKTSCRVKHGGGIERQPMYPTTLDAGSNTAAVTLRQMPHEDNIPICPIRVNGCHVILQFPTRGQWRAEDGEADQMITGWASIKQETKGGANLDRMSCRVKHVCSTLADL